MSNALLVVLIFLIFFGGGGWWWYYHSGYGPRGYGRPVGPVSQYGYDTTATTPTPGAPRRAPHRRPERSQASRTAAQSQQIVTLNDIWNPYLKGDYRNSLCLAVEEIA